MNNRTDAKNAAQHYSFLIFQYSFFIYERRLRRQPYYYCKQAQR